MLSTQPANQNTTATTTTTATDGFDKRTSMNGNGPNEPRHTAWLTPQFVWQLITFTLSFIVVNVVSVVIWGQVLKSDVRSLREQVNNLQSTVSDIRASMPSSAVYDLRMAGYEKDLASHEQRIRELEAYNQNLREKLAASGWRVIQ